MWRSSASSTRAGAGCTGLSKRNERKYQEVYMEKGLIALAAALAIGLSALATGWAQSRIGSAGAGTIAEKPELAGLVIILVAIPETMVLLGVVGAYLIISSWEG